MLGFDRSSWSAGCWDIKRWRSPSNLAGALLHLKVTFEISHRIYYMPRIYLKIYYTIYCSLKIQIARWSHLEWRSAPSPPPRATWSTTCPQVRLLMLMLTYKSASDISSVTLRLNLIIMPMLMVILPPDPLWTLMDVSVDVFVYHHQTWTIPQPGGSSVLLWFIRWLHGDVGCWLVGCLVSW